MQAYSFLNIVVLLNGVEITDWAEDDDAIMAKRLTDSASHKTGSDGKMMLSLSADRSGEMTFKLQQTSPSNAQLYSLISQQEAGAQTFVPVSVRVQDTYRQDLANGGIGYIKKPADFGRGFAAGNQEWVLVFENLELIFGSIDEISPA